MDTVVTVRADLSSMDVDDRRSWRAWARYELRLSGRYVAAVSDDDVVVEPNKVVLDRRKAVDATGEVGELMLVP